MAGAVVLLALAATLVWTNKWPLTRIDQALLLLAAIAALWAGSTPRSMAGQRRTPPPTGP